MDVYYLRQAFESSNDKLLDFFTQVNDKINNLEYEKDQLKNQIIGLADTQRWLQSQIDELKNPPKPVEYVIGVDPISEDILEPAEGHVYKIH